MITASPIIRGPKAAAEDPSDVETQPGGVQETRGLFRFIAHRLVRV